MTALVTTLAAVGRPITNGVRSVGAVTLFAVRTFAGATALPKYWRAFAAQLFKIGWASIPVVGLTAIFTGAALALNIYTGGVRFNAEQFVPNIVALGITRELGPVIAALMLAGRVSAAIAAEIGTMRVTEQIDALVTLATDPFKYLMAPRVAAGLVALPLLVALADIIGIFGGYVVSTQALGFNGAVYVRNTLEFITASDIWSGLIKAAVFGFLLTLMGCYHGYTSRGGAEGVGRATTNAVVSSFILIFFSNYLLTTLFVER